MGQDWIALLNKAKADGAYIVEYLPLTSNDEDKCLVSLPEPDGRQIVNCRTLVDALQRDGALSSHLHEKAVADLGTEGIVRSRVEPPARGSTIYLVANIAGVIADAGLLDAVCEHFRAYVDPRFVEQCRAEAAGQEQANALRTWLRSLVDRVREGLASGAFQTVRMDDASPNLTEDKAEVESFDLRVLRDLLVFRVEPGDVLWIDDRYGNSFSNRDGAPVVGVVEILHELRQRGAITDRDYYDKFLHLRASNARYIPIQADEVLHHLRDASVAEGGVVETPQLSILRRYLAAGLLDIEALQRGPAPAELGSPWGEGAFLFHSLNAVGLALARCFDEAPAPETARAWADWILQNLYTGTFGIPELLEQSGGTGKEFQGRDLAVAIWAALTIATDSEKARPGVRRVQYLQWLQDHVLCRRFKANPEVVSAVSETLSGLIFDKLDTNAETTPFGVAYRIALSQMIPELPELLSEKLARNPQLRARLGLTVHWTIDIAGITFSTPAFVKAAHIAMNGGVGTVTALQPAGSFEVLPVPDGDGTIHQMDIRETESGRSFRLSDPTLALLRESPTDREAVLRANREWFDCEALRFEALINEIVTAPDPALRIERTESHRRSSATCYYRRIEEELGTSGRFGLHQLLPPSADGLLQHFRIDASQVAAGREFRAVLSHAAEHLIAEEGFHEALDRLARFPVRFPAALQAHITRLPATERYEILQAFAKRCHFPLGYLHVIELAAMVGKHQTVLDVATKALDALFDEQVGAQDFRLFHAILERVWSEFSSWKASAGWPSPTRLALAWAHATKLHTIFACAGAAPERLAKWVESAGWQVGAEALRREPDEWNEALHPRLVHREDLLTHGLASIISEANPETIGAFGIPERIRTCVFSSPLGNQLPVFPLLRDPTLGRNALGSILGGDREAALRHILRPDEATLMSSASLRQMTASATELLTHDPGAELAWVVLSAILADFPIYHGLRDQLRTVLSSTDLDALCSANPFSGFLAVRIAAVQAAHMMDDDLRATVEGALLKIAARLGDGDSEVSPGGPPVRPADQAMYLLEGALRATHVHADASENSATLARLLIKIADASTFVATFLKAAAQRLVWDLPIEESEGMWRLALELRARR